MNKICENIYVQQDIEKLANDFNASFLYNKSVLITGATGLIGSEIVMFLAYLNKKFNANISVFALVRNKIKAEQKFKNILSCINLVVQDINEKIKISDGIDFIIHCASNTSSLQMIEKPAETIQTIVNGTQNVLEFAKNKKSQSMVFLSSLEVYGNLNEEKEIEENFVGSIDTMNIRSSYPLAKKMAENLCIAYNKEYSTNVKIARLSQTFGAGVDWDDNRVFAQFAKSAIEKKDIILYTQGNTTRNYCYITDAISAILTILNLGENSSAYNISNKTTKISIKDMANLIAQKHNIGVKFQIDNLERGYNPEIKICLSTKKLEKLGWQAAYDIEEMLERLVLGLSIKK